MRELKMYCSARDTDVHVVLTDEPITDGQASVMDAELICLEIGKGCTGSLCPVCAVSRDAMEMRLVKSGLRPEIQRKVLAHCEGCDRESELVVSSGGYVSCTECGTTWYWLLRPEAPSH